MRKTIAYKISENPKTQEVFTWNPIEDFKDGIEIEEDLPIKGVMPIIRPVPQDNIEDQSIKNQEITNTGDRSKEGSKVEQDDNATVKKEEDTIVDREDNTPATKKSKRYSDNSEFVSDLTDSYIRALKSEGLDESYAKMLVAQDALETGWGKKYAGNWNFGNIIVPKGLNYSYTEGKDKDANGNQIIQKFRNFESMDDYTKYKVALLNGSRYKAFTGSNDPLSFYTRIKRGGYAEDPMYVDKLLQVYNSKIFSAKLGGVISPKIDSLINKFKY